MVIDREAYGLAVLKVREIIRLQKITPVPQMPAFVKGVINLRGRVIPIIDLRIKFGMEAAFADRTCIVVVQVSIGDRGIQMGLIVDSVEEVANLAKDQIEPTPGLRRPHRHRLPAGHGADQRPRAHAAGHRSRDRARRPAGGRRSPRLIPAGSRPAAPSIPCVVNPAVQSPAPEPAHAAVVGRGSIDILLIDDDATVRAVLEKTLHRAGYSVQCAADGKTALRLLALHPFRLVVTDIYMPNMDGYEVIMKINETKPRPLVLAISGGAHSSAASSLKTARLLGSSRLMAKPFDLMEFCTTVGELIGPPSGGGSD